MPDIFVDKNKKENFDSPKNEPELKNPAQTKIVHEPHRAKQNEKSQPTQAGEPKKELPPIDHPENIERHKLLQDLGIKEHGGAVHAFSSYFEAPKKVRFANELDDEFLLLFMRQHFITNLPWILKAFAMGLLPILFEFVGAFGLYPTDFVSISGKFIIYSFWYFFIFSGYLFVNYMTWFYNISLVTNLRIVDIDFSDIVYENVAATKFPQLEDVSYSQIGIVRSLFDYGDVFVQTAGSARNFEFLAVPHPENALRIINSLLGKKRHD